jgi:hypothetical protein
MEQTGDYNIGDGGRVFADSGLCEGGFCLNYDAWDRHGGCNCLGYYEPCYDFAGYGDDLKPRNNTMVINPVPPKKLITRGTVLIGRRWRPQARARVPWGRQRKRGSEVKEVG